MASDDYLPSFSHPSLFLHVLTSRISVLQDRHRARKKEPRRGNPEAKLHTVCRAPAPPTPCMVPGSKASQSQRQHCHPPFFIGVKKLRLGNVPVSHLTHGREHRAKSEKSSPQSSSRSLRLQSLRMSATRQPTPWQLEDCCAMRAAGATKLVLKTSTVMPLSRRLL